MNHTDLGNLNLTEEQIDDLLALMHAFTDRCLSDMKPGALFPEPPKDVPPTADRTLFFPDWTYRLHPVYRGGARP